MIGNFSKLQNKKKLKGEISWVRSSQDYVGMISQILDLRSKMHWNLSNFSWLEIWKNYKKLILKREISCATSFTFGPVAKATLRAITNILLIITTITNYYFRPGTGICPLDPFFGLSRLRWTE